MVDEDHYQRAVNGAFHLLEAHYDPLYGRSMARHFPATNPRAVFGLRDPSAAGFAALAAEVLAACDDARTAVLEQR